MSKAGYSVSSAPTQIRATQAGTVASASSTGSTGTAGQAIIAPTTLTGTVAVGQYVSGTGIPTGTYVTAVTGAAATPTVYLSAVNSATVSGAITFTGSSFNLSAETAPVAGVQTLTATTSAGFSSYLFPVGGTFAVAGQTASTANNGTFTVLSNAGTTITTYNPSGVLAVTPFGTATATGTFSPQTVLSVIAPSSAMMGVDLQKVRYSFDTSGSTYPVLVEIVRFSAGTASSTASSGAIGTFSAATATSVTGTPAVGMYVSGTNINPGAVVTSVSGTSPAYTLGLSLPNTGAVSGALTFTAGTPGTTPTVVQQYGRTISGTASAANMFTAGSNYTLEPAGGTVVESAFVVPYGGTVLYDFPLGTSIDCDANQMLALRMTGTNTSSTLLNTRATMIFERC